jgi:hypothetical protein
LGDGGGSQQGQAFTVVTSIVASHSSTAGPVTLGLELFELASHLVDGLVELLHPVLKRGVLLGAVDRLVIPGVCERRGGGALEGELLPAGALQQALELSAPFGFPKEPPRQSTGPSYRPDDDPKHQGAAIGREGVTGLSHGLEEKN